MASLKDLPPRPRDRNTVPRYPRRVLLGTLAVTVGVAGCTPPSQAQVSGHQDEGEETKAEGTGGSTASRTTITGQGGREPTGFGGQLAGGMPEPWNEGGAGGVGGAATTSAGQGGSCSTGFGGQLGGAAPDPWDGGAGGGAAPDPWSEGGGGASTTDPGAGGGGVGGGEFGGDLAESWGEGGAGGG